MPEFTQSLSTVNKTFPLSGSLIHSRKFPFIFVVGLSSSNRYSSVTSNILKVNPSVPLKKRKSPILIDTVSATPVSSILLEKAFFFLPIIKFHYYFQEYSFLLEFLK